MEAPAPYIDRRSGRNACSKRTGASAPDGPTLGKCAANPTAKLRLTLVCVRSWPQCGKAARRQGGLQLGRRKPDVRQNPEMEIWKASRMAAHGRALTSSRRDPTAEVVPNPSAIRGDRPARSNGRLRGRCPNQRRLWSIHTLWPPWPATCAEHDLRVNVRDINTGAYETPSP